MLCCCARIIFSLPSPQGLSNDARMNKPGLAAGNWGWRLSASQMAGLGKQASRLRKLNKLYGRLPSQEQPARARSS